MKRLRGICWDHTRGFVPLVAVAQRYHERHPDVEIHWEKRSLRAFGESGLEKPCREFDLLVIDHPFCGEAASAGYLLPLDSILDEALLEDYRENSIGPSYASYTIQERQWALPVDAACPVALYRRDLLNQAGREVPGHWKEVLELAEEGRVIFPGIDTDAILHLFSFCLQHEGELFNRTDGFASRESMARALDDLKQLSERCPRACLDMNPINVLETLARSEEVAYCPFAFGYSNYCRTGYGENVVLAAEPPCYEGRELRTVLGGAGMAVSSSSAHPDVAADFAGYCMAANIQKGIYALSGGQPGDRRAWEDAELNRLTHDFFKSAKPAMERSYLRPRYRNFISFQHASGIIVNRFLKGSITQEEAISSISAAFVKMTSTV